MKLNAFNIVVVSVLAIGAICALSSSFNKGSKITDSKLLKKKLETES